MHDTTETKPESPQPPSWKSGGVRDTPKITFVPQKTAAQRLADFTRQLASVGATPEFFLNKAFDYALSLPEISQLKSTTARLEGAAALLLEVSKMLTEEAQRQEEEKGTSQQEEQEEAVATA